MAAAPALAPAPGRLVAVDAFRGLTIALMVLVNTAGMFAESYAPLRHAEWHGWTITDAVFPSFVWIVGLSLTLSRRTLDLTQIFRRGAMLFALGLFLYGFPHFDLSTWRVLGVLQRIAICYVAAALIYRSSGVRGQIIWTASLLGAYTALMNLGDWTVENNFAHRVDAAVLGAHNYAGTKTWDPEGIVSTLPAIATALLGVLAGQMLRRWHSLPDRVSRFFVTGNLLIAAALLLEAWMPINKKLWTVSFTLLMAGLNFSLFATLAWFIDGLGWRRAARPLAVLGANAITIYMVSELLETVLTEAGTRVWLYEAAFRPVLPAVHATFVYSFVYTMLMFAVAYGMHRRGWFVRV